jgi:hypothetical protein
MSGIPQPLNKAVHFADGVSAIALTKRNGDVIPVFIDTIDYAFVRLLHWSHAEHNHTSYAIHSTKNQKHVYMHAFLQGFGTDHKDRNGLNNRRANLRPATQSQQMANSRLLRSNNTSGFRGVYFFGGKWKARIEANGKEKHLGTFDSAIDAALAYDAAALKSFKEFAVLNFPTMEYMHV